MPAEMVKPKTGLPKAMTFLLNKGVVAMSPKV
jgi:hypothetical protein